MKASTGVDDQVARGLLRYPAAFHFKTAAQSTFLGMAAYQVAPEPCSDAAYSRGFLLIATR